MSSTMSKAVFRFAAFQPELRAYATMKELLRQVLRKAVRTADV